MPEGRDPQANIGGWRFSEAHAWSFLRGDSRSISREKGTCKAPIKKKMALVRLLDLHPGPFVSLYSVQFLTDQETSRPARLRQANIRRSCVYRRTKRYRRIGESWSHRAYERSDETWVSNTSVTQEHDKPNPRATWRDNLMEPVRCPDYRSRSVRVAVEIVACSLRGCYERY
jgi:hypothetical protein